MASRHHTRPVLLVPGTGGFAYPYWTVMTRRLVDDDFHVYAKNFPFLNFDEVALSAQKVKRKVEFIQEETGADRVDLVGHSLGGFIARYYVEKLGGQKHVRHLVTLGTPHHGTLLSGLALPFASMRQIFTGSPFLRDMNGGLAANGGNGGKSGGTDYTSVYSVTDECCLPFWSCRLPGATNRRLLLCGHLGLLLHPTAYHWVRETLLRE